MQSIHQTGQFLKLNKVVKDGGGCQDGIERTMWTHTGDHHLIFVKHLSIYVHIRIYILVLFLLFVLLILYSIGVLAVYLSYSHSAPYPCFAAAMIQFPHRDQ